MTRFFLPPTASFLVAALLLGGLSTPAAAQSLSDLRRENQRLQTENKDLRRELQRVTVDLAALQLEADRMRQSLKAGPRGGRAALPPLAEPEISIDESLPSASPRALMKAIVVSYAEATAELDFDPSEGRGDRGYTVYLRTLSHWAVGINRELKSPVSWHVKIIGRGVPVGRGFALRVIAVDPKTGTDLGDPFDAFVARSLALRLQQREQRYGLDEVMVLEGTLEPRVHINEDRLEPGPWDNPRFIGPFAEFGLTVHASRLLPVPEEPDEAASAGG